MAGFTSCYLKVCKHHHVTSFCQWHPFSVQSDWFVLPRHIWSLRALFSKHFKIQRSSQTITIIKTCSNHRTPLALAGPSNVSFKPNTHTFLVTFFSINLTPHIAFSGLLKIAISFSLRHHISLPYTIADSFAILINTSFHF